MAIVTRFRALSGANSRHAPSGCRRGRKPYCDYPELTELAQLRTTVLKLSRRELAARLTTASGSGCTFTARSIERAEISGYLPRAARQREQFVRALAFVCRVSLRRSRQLLGLRGVA